MNNIVLANKKYQSTRFVRSLLRGLTAALRNMPTIFTGYAKEHFEIGQITFNHTRGLELEAIMAKLQNVKTLFFIIGFTQILEIYCIVSLEVQHASHFPIQAWASIDSAKAQLANLAENWSWCTNELKLAGIGTPQNIINNIMDKKTYTPYVPIGSIRKNMDKANFDIDIVELFNADASSAVGHLTCFCFLLKQLQNKIILGHNCIRFKILFSNNFSWLLLLRFSNYNLENSVIQKFDISLYHCYNAYCQFSQQACTNFM